MNTLSRSLFYCTNMSKNRLLVSIFVNNFLNLMNHIYLRLTRVKLSKNKKHHVLHNMIIVVHRKPLAIKDMVISRLLCFVKYNRHLP